MVKISRLQDVASTPLPKRRPHRRVAAITIRQSRDDHCTRKPRPSNKPPRRGFSCFGLPAHARRRERRGATFARSLSGHKRVTVGENQVTRCPICNSEAAEIDRGLFDGVAFDCKFHGRFRVSGTVLAQRKGRTRRQWEHALMLARARASETTTPLISSELL